MSSKIETISMPRELTDEMAEVISERLRVCGGIADDIWEALKAAAPVVERQPVDVPVVGKLVPNGGGFDCWHPQANQGQAVVLQTDHVAHVAELQATIAQQAADIERLKGGQGEPVITILQPDPYDERGGAWMSNQDLRKLEALPVGTKLYTSQPMLLSDNRPVAYMRNEGIPNNLIKCTFACPGAFGVYRQPTPVSEVAPDGWKLVPLEPTPEMVAVLKARLIVTSRGSILSAGVSLADAIAAAPVYLDKVKELNK